LARWNRQNGQTSLEFKNSESKERTEVKDKKRGRQQTRISEGGESYGINKRAD
jgi:hypothetical protein